MHGEGISVSQAIFWTIGLLLIVLFVAVCGYLFITNFVAENQKKNRKKGDGGVCSEEMYFANSSKSAIYSQSISADKEDKEDKEAAEAAKDNGGSSEKPVPNKEPEKVASNNISKVSQKMGKEDEEEISSIASVSESVAEPTQNPSSTPSAPPAPPVAPPTSSSATTQKPPTVLEMTKPTSVIFPVAPPKPKASENVMKNAETQNNQDSHDVVTLGCSSQRSEISSFHVNEVGRTPPVSPFRDGSSETVANSSIRSSTSETSIVMKTPPVVHARGK